MVAMEDVDRWLTSRLNPPKSGPRYLSKFFSGMDSLTRLLPQRGIVQHLNLSVAANCWEIFCCATGSCLPLLPSTLMFCGKSVARSCRGYGLGFLSDQIR